MVTATAATTITRTVTLVLTQEESDWLRAITQSPLPNMPKESYVEQEIRKSIFMALNNTPLPNQTDTQGRPYLYNSIYDQAVIDQTPR